MYSFHDELCSFVGQLESVADDKSLASLWFVREYLMSQFCDKEKVQYEFFKWLDSNRQKIISRLDEVFNFSVRGEIANIINQIRDIWKTLPQEDRDVVWQWLDHFSSLSIAQ